MIENNLESILSFDSTSKELYEIIEALGPDHFWQTSLADIPSFNNDHVKLLIKSIHPDTLHDLTTSDKLHKEDFDNLYDTQDSYVIHGLAYNPMTPLNVILNIIKNYADDEATMENVCNVFAPKYVDVCNEMLKLGARYNLMIASKICSLDVLEVLFSLDDIDVNKELVCQFNFPIKHVNKLIDDYNFNNRKYALLYVYILDMWPRGISAARLDLLSNSSLGRIRRLAQRIEQQFDTPTPLF